MINHIIDNRYTIVERIGGGGMADVYKAHDKLLDRFVAIKILKSDFIDNEDLKNSFRQEALASAKLSHPNIVNTYDVGEEDTIYYIVMEYIKGETLKDKIEREAPFSPTEAIKISLEIADGLENAHLHGIVHCDVKPHNILISESGKIKVTDFGIARAVTSTTIDHKNTILGSVHYFSPEQAKGATIDVQSDVYSLGIVLYEMLTNRLPFTGNSPTDIALKHIQEEPISVRKINPNIPPLIEAIVVKSMAKEPSHRFNNIREMIADFKLAKKFLEDDSNRKNAPEDFSTQLLPKIEVDSTKQNSFKLPFLKNRQADSNDGNNAERKTTRLIVMSLAGLLLASALLTFLIFSNFGGALKDVVVPNLVGKQTDIAKNILKNQKLEISITETFSDTVPVGYVISQQPEAGVTVKETRIINVVVSRGGEITAVPDVRGLVRRDAELKLTNSGFILGKIEEQYSPNVQEDYVINQNPQPPSMIPKGSTIDLILSKGNSPRKIILPNFSGLPLSAAKAQIEALNLKLGRITYVSSNLPEDSVVSQNPRANTELLEGDVIDLSLAKSSSGQDNSGAVRRATVQVTIPQTSEAGSQILKIILSDNNGRKIVYEKQHKSGERVEKSIEGTGPTKVQVYINDRLYQEQNI